MINSIQPLVSIVIPVYNVELWLAECLDSAIRQTLQDIEIICVNDGSTDKSGTILQTYATRDTRIKIINQENAGLSAARNTGMDTASGKYIYFLDSDDMIVPDAIKKLYELAEKNSLDQIIFTASVFKDKDAKISEAAINEEIEYNSLAGLPAPEITGSGSETLKILLDSNCYFAPVPYRFFRREILLKYKLHFPVGIIHEDEYFAPISLFVSPKVLVFNEKLYQRRLRDNSIMTSPAKIKRSFCGLLAVISHLQQDIPQLGIERSATKCLSTLLGKLVDSAAQRYTQLSAPEKASIENEMQNETLTESAYWQRFFTLQSIKDIAAVRNSFRYKLGYFLAYVPRMIFINIIRWKQS